MVEKYIRVSTIEEVHQAINDALPDTYSFLSGGTDLLLQEKHGRGKESKTFIDISNVNALRGITEIKDGVLIGAATKLSEIESSELIQNQFGVLIQGVHEIGSPQIRNLATLGGNICNASPSADSIPPLLVLDAVLFLEGTEEKREVPIAKFFIGPGKTILRENEMLVSIFIPYGAVKGKSEYIKLKSRQVLDLAFVGVAVNIIGEGDYQIARIALGAVAPTPIRAKKAEALFTDADKLDKETIRKIAEVAGEECSPISDIRASAEYRKEMVKNLTEKALLNILNIN